MEMTTSHVANLTHQLLRCLYMCVCVFGSDEKHMLCFFFGSDLVISLFINYYPTIINKFNFIFYLYKVNDLVNSNDKFILK